MSYCHAYSVKNWIAEGMGGGGGGGSEWQEKVVIDS